MITSDFANFAFVTRDVWISSVRYNSHSIACASKYVRFHVKMLAQSLHSLVHLSQSSNEPIWLSLSLHLNEHRQSHIFYRLLSLWLSQVMYVDDRRHSHIHAGKFESNNGVWKHEAMRREETKYWVVQCWDATHKNLHSSRDSLWRVHCSHSTSTDRMQHSDIYSRTNEFTSTTLWMEIIPQIPMR